MERSGVLPATQFAFRKIWVPVMHFCVSHTLQSALESWQEARIVQIDFSAAVDRVNHQGILYKLCSMSNGGYVLSILTQFLYQTDHSTSWWMVVGLTLCQECRRASDLGPLLFLLYTSEVFYILENKLIGHADDSSLMAVVPSPGVGITEAEFLIRDLCRVSEWYDL